MFAVAAGVAAALAGSAAAQSPSCAQKGATATCTFNFTGGDQAWTVPAEVTGATFDVQGAQGGTGGNLMGGLGGEATAELRLTPGDTVTLVVGGQGGSQINGGCGGVSSPGGFNGGGESVGTDLYCPGGGGGGASDVRIGGAGLSNRILVAGGGGGTGNCQDDGQGGGGGGLTGGNGSNCFEAGVGGSGGNQDGTSGSGQLGVGSTNAAENSGGGGGGGYYGGAGAPLTNPQYGSFGGGGGGSGFGPAGTTFKAAVRSSNGVITVSYRLPSVSCSPRSVVAGAASTCTATVPDSTASGNTPTGAVRFSASAPGKFSPGSCILVKSGPAAARCAVLFTPSGSGALSVTIIARYGGDANHPPSSATTTLKVTSEAGCAGRSARLVGGAGSDRLLGTRRGDVIAGGAGNDLILAGRSNDLVCAGPGNDRVLGGRGNDRLFGQAGNDTLSGGPGRDVLSGGRGNDRLFGGPGNDRVFGGPGNDRINPGAGRDFVSASAGTDHIFSVDGQRDLIDCGPGRDVAVVDAVDRVRRCETVIRVPTPRGRQRTAPRAGLG